MKHLFRHTWIKILAAALSLSLIAAALALVLGGTASPLRSWGETVSRPFLRLFSSASQKIRQGEDYLRGVDRLKEENIALRRQVADLQKAARQGELAAAENDRLRSLLDLREQGRDLTLEPAWVVGRTPDNWQGVVTLDKGRKQGVQTGQCVIDETGALVGRVKETGESWCSVSLLCDGAFQLAGQGTKSGVLGALEGDLALLPREELRFSCITDADPVQLGESVVTFAAQGVYPSALLVGSITSLEEDPGGLTKSALVTPAADLKNLGQVFVVTDFWEDR